MTPGRRILLVDDEAPLIRSLARILTSDGYQVDLAEDGTSALALVAAHAFDVIVTDVQMPDFGGVDVLRRVREHDLDVPVLLLTGTQRLDAAVDALEFGALQYLIKPVDIEPFKATIERAVILHDLAKAKRASQELRGPQGQPGDRAGLLAAFERTLRSLHVAFQPIVKGTDQSIFGYEALLRGQEPALPSPFAILRAAKRLGRRHDLGQLIRQQAAKAFDDAPDHSTLFVNVDVSDLLDHDLYQPHAPLSRLAHRTVLEFSEHLPFDVVPDVPVRTAELRRLGFRLALDHFGAGPPGLTSFSLLTPDLVKLDSSLLRDVHQSTAKQTAIRTLTAACHQLDIHVIATGIETDDERAAVEPLGCDWTQGYLFGKPGPLVARG